MREMLARRHSMRIAWIGPQPLDVGGVPKLAGLMLLGLAKTGVAVDAFYATGDEPTMTLDHPSLRLVSESIGWDADSNANRSAVTRYMSGQRARARAQVRLAAMLAEHHSASPYDLIYQFSQFELMGVRPRVPVLPPIVVHPETHAAGELRWLLRESGLVCRNKGMFASWLAATAMMTARATIQNRDVRRVRGVIAPSQVFAEHLIRDYRVPSRLLHVVPNCVDLAEFAAPDRRPRSGPVKVLFVSRMAVRKGVDMLVALTHRLADLEGVVEIAAIGSQSTWSDYRPLLGEIDPRVAHYRPQVSPAELVRLYGEADLLVQPSRFEPFALTVAEGLACGLGVVASDEVGACENVDPRCCAVFAAGDLDGFERAVRNAIARARTPEADGVSTLAQMEAARLFAPSRVAEELRAVLEKVASQ